MISCLSKREFPLSKILRTRFDRRHRGHFTLQCRRLIMPRSGFEDTSYEHISQVKSGIDNQQVQLKRMLIKESVPTPNMIFQNSFRLTFRKRRMVSSSLLFHVREMYSYSLSFHMTTFPLFSSYENPTNCSSHRISITEIQHL